ncbi:MAG: heparinase II/III family protein [Cyclobacteriaceae bacterium]
MKTHRTSKIRNSRNISAFKFCLVLSLFIPLTSFPQDHGEARNILTGELSQIDLSKDLITDHSWITLPAYKDRSFWNSLPTQIKAAYISAAEKHFDYGWPVVKATDYLEIIRSGNRLQEVYAGPRAALSALVMGELVEGQGRFIDQIINAVWYYSEQTWWGWSAHFYLQQAPNGLPDANEPTIDLGVGEMANSLAWTWYLFKDEFDKIHPLISVRLKEEVIKKVLVPYYMRDDFWWMSLRPKEGYSVNMPDNPWRDYRNEHNPQLLVSAKITGSGVNNWNPWVNYNMLNCILLLEDDPAKKQEALRKLIRSLDQFPNSYPDDGGCDEGPSYWGVAGSVLYQSLAILKQVTKGKFDVFDDPLIQNIGKYFYKVNIHAPYFMNFADADATTGGNPYQVYQYGKAIKDPVMQHFGAYLARLNNWGEKNLSGRINDQIEQLTRLDEILNAEAKEALVADFWLPDTQVGGGRDAANSFKGFFFGAKGGHNSEAHNHNDVGSAVMYYDGKPCLIDLGREEYTAKTFSKQRYDIWTMQSLYHNVPVINGIAQMQGRKYHAENTRFSAGGQSVIFSTDIAKAYPGNATVKSWLRTYTLKRGKSFSIGDQFELAEKNDEITSSNFMTYCKVTEAKPGLLKFEGDGFILDMRYNPRVV